MKSKIFFKAKTRWPSLLAIGLSLLFTLLVIGLHRPDADADTLARLNDKKWTMLARSPCAEGDKQGSGFYRAVNARRFFEFYIGENGQVLAPQSAIGQPDSYSCEPIYQPSFVEEITYEED